MTARTWACQVCGQRSPYEDPDPSPSLGRYRLIACPRCGSENEQVYDEIGRGWRSTGRVKRADTPSS